MGKSSDTAAAGQKYSTGNAEFLRAVFHALPESAAPVVAAFAGDPNKPPAGAWRVHPVNGSLPPILRPGTNQYFSIASVRPDPIKGYTRTHAAAVHALVIDDIGAAGKVDPELVTLPPSWELETSPDNCQWGYILAEPVSDLGLFRRVLVSLKAKGYTDPNGNNPVRLVRLPEGVNGKGAVVEHHGEPFPCALHQWAPERRYTLAELVEGLGLKVEPETPDAPHEAAPEPHGAWDQSHARKLAWDAARRTVDDPDLGRHDEIFKLGCYAARDGLPRDALDYILTEFVAHMRPCNTNGEPAEVNWDAERKTIRDGYRDGLRDKTAEPKADFSELLKQPPDPSEGATEGQQDKMRLCDLSRLGSVALPPPRFIVRPIIPRKHLTLFGSHGGSGKTTVALSLAAHVATGRDWAGLQVDPGRVCFLSFEDDEDLTLWRLQNIADEHGMEPARIAERLTLIDATDAEPLMFEAMHEGVKTLLPSAEGKAVHEWITAERFDLLVVDNASDAFDGDEINRRMVRAFVRWLAKSVRGHGGAVLLLAHVDKQAAKFGSKGNSYSGSTAWHNSARSRLALIDDELHHEKLNVGKKLEAPIPVEWSEIGVPVPTPAGSDAPARALVEQATDAAVLAAIAAAIEAGECIPTARTGPATAWHVLSSYSELPEPMREKSGKRDFEASMVRLARAGRIERESYTNEHRHQRERWSLKGAASMCVNARQSTSTHVDAGTPQRARVNAQGVWGIDARTQTDAPPVVLREVFGTRTTLTHATLTQGIGEQTGTDTVGAERIVAALVQAGALVRQGDAYALPPVVREDAA